MKQLTNAPHGGGNPLRITGLMNICNMLRIKADKNGDLKVFFRQAHLLGAGFQDLEVPYIRVPRTPMPNDPNPSTVERYYFCRRFMVEFSVYGPLLLKTKDFEDNEVATEAANAMSVEERELDIKLNGEDYRKHQWPYAARMVLFEKCVHKYHKTHSYSQVARMLFVTEHEVRRCLNGRATVTRFYGGDDPTVPPRVRSRLQDHPDYAAIQKEVEAARVKAYNNNPRITGSFTASDALPTMYDVQGNSGSHNGDLVVPKVCPVLRIPLDYNVFEKRPTQYKVRIWRKTPGPDGTAPMDKDNVSIMSRKAAMIIEGAQVASALRHLNLDERKALAEWQAKYGTRTVPRPTKIGRPRKP